MTRKEYYDICGYLNEIITSTKWENHVYIVGGAVRDYIMGNLIKDIDIVIDLKDGGIEFSQWLYDNGFLMHEPITYPTYGTSMFTFSKFPFIEIEAVHTRKEQYKDPNSRNTEQEFGTIEEDSIRRDLTINSLYYNVSKLEYIDPTGMGQNDIKDGVIRVTNRDPNVVYIEDGLRILRTIRFATRYNFRIDYQTYDAMFANVDRLSTISKERIADELNKMLMCDEPSSAIKIIHLIGAMKFVIPELDVTFGMEQNKYHSGTVFDHTMMVLDNMVKAKVDSLEIRMAGLLHDIGKVNTMSKDDNGNVHFYQHELESSKLCRIILKRLKYSNDFIDNVVFLCKNHMRTKQWGDDIEKIKDKTLRKFQYECKTEHNFVNLLKLIDADNKAHADGFCLMKNVNNILHKTSNMFYDGTAMFEYELPINGDDVMEVRGIKQGREVKEVLDYILKLCFNNPKITKEECLKRAKGYKSNKKNN